VDLGDHIVALHDQQDAKYLLCKGYGEVWHKMMKILKTHYDGFVVERVDLIILAIEIVN
jgi:hypothetical protein